MGGIGPTQNLGRSPWGSYHTLVLIEKNFIFRILSYTPIIIKFFYYKIFYKKYFLKISLETFGSIKNVVIFVVRFCL